MSPTAEEVVILALTIAVLLKLLMSIEDWLMYHRYFSVRNIPDEDPTIMIKIYDADGAERLLRFESLDEYNKWIENHRKVYAQISHIEPDK